MSTRELATSLLQTWQVLLNDGFTECLCFELEFSETLSLLVMLNLECAIPQHGKIPFVHSWLAVNDLLHICLSVNLVRSPKRSS